MVSIILAFNIYIDYKIDSIIHQDLYNHGLRFSYEWAVPYWTYMRTNMIFTTVASILAAYIAIKTLFAPTLPKPITSQEIPEQRPNLPTVKIKAIKKAEKPPVLEILEKLGDEEDGGS